MSGARLGLVLAEGTVTHKDHQSPLNQYQYQFVCVFPENYVLIHSRASLHGDRNASRRRQRVIWLPSGSIPISYY